MLALAPQILCGLGEEGGEPIFGTSSRLQDLSASPRLRSSTYKDLKIGGPSHKPRILRSFGVLRRFAAPAASG
jgi:hypothetical protein